MTFAWRASFVSTTVYDAWDDDVRGTERASA